MAKQPRTQLSGKEARYILKQNNINLAWLAEQLNIKPQSLHSRLNAAEFKVANQMEVNSIVGKRIFHPVGDAVVVRASLYDVGIFS